MTPLLLSGDVARQRSGDLRRDADRRRLACGADGCDGFFSSLVARVRSDLQRLQLGPTDAVVCPC